MTQSYYFGHLGTLRSHIATAAVKTEALRISFMQAEVVWAGSKAQT